MLKRIIAIVILTLTVVSCKNESKQDNVITETSNENTFEMLLEEYYEDGLKLNPLNATFAGDNRYNDRFPNILSNDYINELKSHYTSYKEKALAIDNTTLTKEEQMTKDILLWECNINLEALTFRTDLFPIDQMWSVNLVVGQLASGASAQPFKTVSDYENC